MWNVGKVSRGNGMYLSAWASAWSFWCTCQHWRQSAAAARGSEWQCCVKLLYMNVVMQLMIGSAYNMQEIVRWHSSFYLSENTVGVQHAENCIACTACTSTCSCPSNAHHTPASHGRVIQDVHHGIDSAADHRMYCIHSAAWLSLQSCTYLLCAQCMCAIAHSKMLHCAGNLEYKYTRNNAKVNWAMHFSFWQLYSVPATACCCTTCQDIFSASCRFRFTESSDLK